MLLFNLASGLAGPQKMLTVTQKKIINIFEACARGECLQLKRKNVVIVYSLKGRKTQKILFLLFGEEKKKKIKQNFNF